MYIQYVGFKVAASSRIYNFDVIDTQDAREFTVEVQSETFRSARLKLQEGPDICFTRLKQELERETQASRAEPHLGIREEDITEYVGRNYPPRRSKRRGAAGQSQSIKSAPGELQ